MYTKKALNRKRGIMILLKNEAPTATTNLNIDTTPYITEILDLADGKQDKQICKNVWQNFNSIFKTNLTKDYISVEEANDIIRTYLKDIPEVTVKNKIELSNFICAYTS